MILHPKFPSSVQRLSQLVDLCTLLSSRLLTLAIPCHWVEVPAAPCPSLECSLVPQDHLASESDLPGAQGTTGGSPPLVSTWDDPSADLRVGNGPDRWEGLGFEPALQGCRAPCPGADGTGRGPGDGQARPIGALASPAWAAGSVSL